MDSSEAEYKAVAHLVSALGFMSASNPDKIVDLLTGYLWDEEEAGEIKKSTESRY